MVNPSGESFTFVHNWMHQDADALGTFEDEHILSQDLADCAGVSVDEPSILVQVAGEPDPHSNLKDHHASFRLGVAGHAGSPILLVNGVCGGREFCPQPCQVQGLGSSIGHGEKCKLSPGLSFKAKGLSHGCVEIP